MKAAIEKRLAVLMNLPMWSVGRAGDVDWFQFGGHHAVPSRTVEIKDVGDWALHTQCNWVLTSSQYGPAIAGSESDPDDLDPLGTLGLVCQAIAADNQGRFVLQFASGHCLKVEPDDDAEESWRFFEPYRKTPHFVVSAGGISRA
jgi:hypothetical protein